MENNRERSRWIVNLIVLAIPATILLIPVDIMSLQSLVDLGFKGEILENAGAEVMILPSKNNHIDLNDAINILYEKGIKLSNKCNDMLDDAKLKINIIKNENFIKTFSAPLAQMNIL